MSPGRNTGLLALTLGGALLGVAQAGDIHTLSRVIFLPNSAAVLAVDEGEHDGSGFPFVEFTMLDTRDGKTLWHAAHHPLPDKNGFKFERYHDVGDVQKLREQWFKTYWTKLGQSSDLGAPVFSKPRYQLPAPDLVPAGMWGQAQVKVKLWSKPVPIFIKQAPSGEKCPEWVFWKPQTYALYVGGQKLAAGKHNCAMGYTVSRVDVKGNRVLVAINAFTAGFEGPNNEQILVAATVK